MLAVVVLKEAKTVDVAEGDEVDQEGAGDGQPGLGRMFAMSLGMPFSSLSMDQSHVFLVNSMILKTCSGWVGLMVES